jgi:hypothetical protein
MKPLCVYYWLVRGASGWAAAVSPVSLGGAIVTLSAAAASWLDASPASESSNEIAADGLPVIAALIGTSAGFSSARHAEPMPPIKAIAKAAVRPFRKNAVISRFP